MLARFMDWVGHWGGSSMSEEEMGGHEVWEVRGLIMRLACCCKGFGLIPSELANHWRDLLRGDMFQCVWLLC